MRKFILLILIACVGVGYFAYPFFTLDRLAVAIQRGDEVIVDSIIDWKQVRDSLRVDAMRHMSAQSSAIDASSGVAAAGSLLGMALSGPIVDRMLESYVNGRALIDGVRNETSLQTDPLRLVHGSRFVSPAVFEFKLQNPNQPDTIVPVVMELQGMQWRITRVIVGALLRDKQDVLGNAKP